MRASLNAAGKGTLIDCTYQMLQEILNAHNSEKKCETVQLTTSTIFTKPLSGG